MGGCTVSVDIEALEAYRRGVTTGVMQNATPNVVRELIGWIDELTRDNAALREVLFPFGIVAKQLSPEKSDHARAGAHFTFGQILAAAKALESKP